VLGRYSRLDLVARRLRRIRSALDGAGPRLANGNAWRSHALARRLTSEELDRMVDDYRSGEGSTVLARRYAVSENGVLAFVKRSGVRLRPPGR